MKKNAFVLWLSVLLLCPFRGWIPGTPSPLFGQAHGAWEFVDQDIHEILYALSLSADISIVGDDTVWGKATFRFAGADFSQAFDSFLAQNRLFVHREAQVWTVSKIQITEQETRYNIDALDVLPARLLEKIALVCGLPVSWQLLPSGTVSVHTGFLPSAEALKAAVQQFANCTVREDRGRYIVDGGKSATLPSGSSGGEQIHIDISIDQDGKQTVSADIRRARFFDVADKLFAVAGREYCITLEAEGIIPRTIFSNKPFDEAVQFLASQAGMEGVLENNIYSFIPVRDKRGLMTNAGKTWREYSLKHLTAADFIPLLAGRFGPLDVVSLAGGHDFTCLVSEAQGNEIAVFIHENDRAAASRLMTLRYLSADKFIANLPPGIAPHFIVKSGGNTSFYYTGSEESYQRLLSVLREVDKPARQIRYDLLIVQFQETQDTSWKSSFSASTLGFGDRNNAAVQLGNVLNLNFNVVTALGLTFAASLQSALSENKASVFADTTLHGVSGEKISFSNTNTYRYRDNNLDPETGKPVYTGVTREIASGLILDITGTVSGDGMITSKVTASVSRRGADVSAATGNPPPTSEKSITTEVRSRSGEPVILSGLVQNDETMVAERTPFISRIPLLGKLFSADTKTKEHTEMIIYLLPNAENGPASDTGRLELPEERSHRVYRTVILGEKQ